MTADEIKCLQLAAQTFGYRDLDGLLPTFRQLQKRGLVYETVRAFYITAAGKLLLSSSGGNRD